MLPPPRRDRPGLPGAAAPDGRDGAERATGAPAVASRPPLSAEERLRYERARRARLARRRARIRRNRLVAATGLGAVVALGALAAGSIGGGPIAQTPTSHLVPAPPPSLRAHTSLASRVTVPGGAPALTWPTRGQGAVAVLGLGLMAASPAERPVPIASVTKLMTAYLVLRDHPLLPGVDGPVLTMTAADVAAWQYASSNGNSNVPVALGEQLSEYQLLEALLIPSADNVADRLAAWDAGSVAAFVAKMNATAALLGLRHTRYADASGVDPGSRSTAADQARLGALLMSNPVVRAIVRQKTIPFPVAGHVWNYNPALGDVGIIGIKSGFTPQAQASLVTAAFRSVAGHSVLVVVASLTQMSLYSAAVADEALLAQAGSALVAFRVVAPRAEVGSVTPGWAPTPDPLLTPAGRTLVVGWPGLSFRRAVEVPAVAPVARRAGAIVGSLAVSTTEGTIAEVPLHLRRALPPVPPGWTPAQG